MTTKIAISLPDEQVAAAKRAVAEGRARSVSAYVSAALQDYGEDDVLEVIIRDRIAEYGEPTPEDVAYVEGQIALHEAKQRKAAG